MIRLSIPVRQALGRLTLPVLAALSFGLILIGKADVVAEQYLRARLSDVLAPIYGIAAGPVEAARNEIADVTGLWSLRAENQRLTRELATSQAVVEIMGKLQGLLEAISESTGTPSMPTTR